MVNKVTEPEWWLKEKEGGSSTDKIVLGGIFGFLIGIIIVFTFSELLLENLGGWWGVYGVAFGFVVLGGLLGWAFAQDQGDKDYMAKDKNYWRS